MFVLFILWVFIQFHQNDAKRTNYLSPGKLNSISRLIQHPGLPAAEKAVVQRVLYTHYESWAIHQSYLFSRTCPRHVITSIGRPELTLSAQIGLHKSTKNYDGRAPFAHYAKFYIRGELCRSVRDYYANQLNTSYNTVGAEPDAYEFENAKSAEPSPDSVVLRKEMFRNWWANVGEQPEIVQRMISLKYDPWFQVQRSNAEVAALIGYSEEHVRRTMADVLRRIIQAVDGVRVAT
jgi:DNA-directed RNA polymerase specialized sigma subunit